MLPNNPPAVSSLAATAGVLAPDMTSLLSGAPLCLTSDQQQQIAQLCPELCQTPDSQASDTAEEYSPEAHSPSGGTPMPSPGLDSSHSTGSGCGPRTSTDTDIGTGTSTCSPISIHTSATTSARTGSYILADVQENIRLLVVHTAGGARGARPLLLRTPALLLSPLPTWFAFLDALGLELHHIQVGGCYHLQLRGRGGCMPCALLGLPLQSLLFLPSPTPHCPQPLPPCCCP